MTLYKAQVIFPMTTALPEDAVTNSFHFDDDLDSTNPNFANLIDIIYDFYANDAPGQTATVSSYFSPAMSSTATVKVYNLSQPKPRWPVYEADFTLSAASSTVHMPAECAVVLSFQAQKTAGVNQAWKRNRIYLGPLNGSANAGVVGRPSGSFRLNVAAAAAEMLRASTASLSWTWVTYSERMGDHFPVHDGWCDNAWDTQRRRGLAPTERLTWDADTND